MRTIISSFCIVFLLTISAYPQQGFSPLLEEVIGNNTGLEAFRMQTDADKMDSKTGIYLQNPEVGFNYLWGSPADIANRTDINIMQSFDFPSAYSHRKNISELRSDQADLQYLNQVAMVTYEARLVCIDLVFYTSLISENESRLVYARSIKEATETMYDQGKVNILERNKAHLNFASAESDHQMLQTEMNALLADLRRLNGGKDISFPYKDYPPVQLPDKYDDWFRMIEEDNPYFRYLNASVEISENREKLNRAKSLPKFAAGYMSETVGDEQHQGLSVGMSIPLWENKNTVKAARAQTIANLAMVEDARLQLYDRLHASFNKVKELQSVVEGYSTALMGSSNTELLKKAYDMGEISLIEYLVEVQFYYDTKVKAFEAQREMYRAIAELQRWEQ